MPGAPPPPPTASSPTGLMTGLAAGVSHTKKPAKRVTRAVEAPHDKPPRVVIVVLVVSGVRVGGVGGVGGGVVGVAVVVVGAVGVVGVGTASSLFPRGDVLATVLREAAFSFSRDALSLAIGRARRRLGRPSAVTARRA